MTTAAKKTPARKAPAKKAAAKPRPRIAVVETKMVSVDTLSTFKGNPRRGNIDAIAKSLRDFGQFKPIVVNVRDSHILAGNHTFLATKKNGDTEILVSFVDVDDKTAKAMVLADNKLSDMGQYDEELLGRLLDDIGADMIEATGYSTAEVEELTGLLAKQGAEALDMLGEVYGDDTPKHERPDFSEAAFGDEDEAIEPAKVVEDDRLLDAEDTLPGAFQLSDEMVFEGWGKWGIPKIRTDMLMTPEELPANLTTWAGSATRDNEDPEQWWLYNYGIDSTSGMKDISKMILSFFAHDDYFENWWWYPHRFVTKMLNSKVKYAVMHDFSPEGAPFPMVYNLYQLYRQRWLARYMQEAGIKVIPNLGWCGGEDDFQRNYQLASLPKDGVCRLICFQLQTFNQEWVDKPENEVMLRKNIQNIYDHLKPEVLLLYAGKPGTDYVQAMNLPWKVVALETRNNKLGEKAKDRKRKSTF